jgi:hypothetical protein
MIRQGERIQKNTGRSGKNPQTLDLPRSRANGVSPLQPFTGFNELLSLARQSHTLKDKGSE